MSIPKIIHYCWFGGNPLPKSAEKCIESWKKYCPDYEIRRWDESNFDAGCNGYCAAMLEKKKWAFLSDYARLKIVYENGGVYLDTDVQLVKPLDPLVEQGAYMGFENTDQVATGLGFAAPAGHEFLAENMAYYEMLTDFETLRACPQITTELLEKHGLVRDRKQRQQVGGLTIYPEDWLCPKDERTGLLNRTENTVSIHHFDASWFEESWKEGQKKRWRREKIRYVLQTPNRLMRKLLGAEQYEKVRRLLKGTHQ
jgi:hypothetical protein